MGKTLATRIPTTIEGASVNLLIWNKTWSACGDYIACGDDLNGDYYSGHFKIHIWRTDSFWPEVRFDVKVTWSDVDFTVTNIHWAGDNITIIYAHTDGGMGFYRHCEAAGSLSLVIEGKERDTTEWETRYDQISASVTDPNSIEKYGERDGGSVTYPLLETVEQCEAVGKKIIRDSHRMLGQADFLIPFNPLVKVGQTIAVIDNKICLDERYYVESISHNIDINGGKIKARTQVGGVLYV